MGTTRSKPIDAAPALQRIDELVKHYRREETEFKALANKETTHRFLSKQQEFQAKGVPSQITIRYHYTRRSSLRNIQKHGLLTRKDQYAKLLDSWKTGSAYGEGIYTGNNPLSFRGYGEIGIIVACLEGKTSSWTSYEENYKKNDIDTVIGYDEGCPSRHEIVLKTSAQCLPLVCYEKVAWDEFRVVQLAGFLKEHVLDELKELTVSATVKNDDPPGCFS